MTATKLAIILGIIAAAILIAGYYRMEQNIYGNGIAVKDDINTLNLGVK